MAQTDLEFALSSLGALCGGAACAVVVRRSPAPKDWKREWPAAATLFGIVLLVSASVGLHWTSVIAGNEGSLRLAFVAVSVLIILFAILGTTKRLLVLLQCRHLDTRLSGSLLNSALGAVCLAFVTALAAMVARIVVKSQAGEAVTTAALASALVAEITTRVVEFKGGLFTQNLRYNILVTGLDLGITLAALTLHVLLITANPFAWLIYLDTSVQALAITLSISKHNNFDKHYSGESFISGERGQTPTPLLRGEKRVKTLATEETTAQYEEEMQDDERYGGDPSMLEQDQVVRPMTLSLALQPPPSRQSWDSISNVSSHLSRTPHPNVIRFTPSSSATGAFATLLSPRKVTEEETAGLEDVSEGGDKVGSFLSPTRLPVPPQEGREAGQGKRGTRRWSEQSRYSRVSTFFEPNPINLPPPIYLARHKTPQAMQETLEAAATRSRSVSPPAIGPIKPIRKLG